ncbi:GNAT family N-acetyltransferase ['Osedax' symbiont bacterium Rs2_46_30_T18]|nr:GNAT family N-acetyltransferase ['Osedax' symbiont bacterium Rs2_46_30_T18]
MKGYSISSDQSKMDLNAIHTYLSKSYWAEGVPRETLAKALQNSLCFGVFCADQQIGFARLITDKATFAYLADVYILEQHRGKGLSKWLMQEIIRHPQNQGLRRIVLATKDAHSLYAQYDFKALTHPDKFMELWKPDVYQNS